MPVCDASQIQPVCELQSPGAANGRCTDDPPGGPCGCNISCQNVVPDPNQCPACEWACSGCQPNGECIPLNPLVCYWKHDTSCTTSCDPPVSITVQKTQYTGFWIVLAFLIAILFYCMFLEKQTYY